MTLAILMSVQTVWPAEGENSAAIGGTNSTTKPTLLVVVGAAGEEEFGTAFSEWGARWKAAGEKCGAETILIGTGTANTNSPTDLDQIKKVFEVQAKEGLGEFWIVLIGHGTFDGRSAKFNLRGPDFSSADLSEWLKPFKRPIALADCSSASGPFLKALTGSGRAIITSTKSGGEHNYSRFGRYLAESLSDPLADLDKDGQTSLLELFLSASSKVAEFYKSEGRLATEHSLLDDNGDGMGTPSEWFRGIRATKKSKDGAIPDGLFAHQFHLLRSEQEQKLSAEARAKRNELEVQIESLREKKVALGEEAYYQQLEKILLELARLYEKAENSK